MLYRVIQTHAFKTQTGGEVTKEPGQLVEVFDRATADALKRAGIIGAVTRTHSLAAKYDSPLEPPTRTRRIGIFTDTQRHYSGGRIYLYQYALTCASLGNEVFLITESFPRWAVDYPKADNLKVRIHGSDKIPLDLDLAVSDSKGAQGIIARTWKREHPLIPFVVFNFETSNWVRLYSEEYANMLMHDAKERFSLADAYVSCSAEGAKYLMEWWPKEVPNCVLYPVVNSFIADSVRRPANKDERPYAVWSARGPRYKGGHVAVEVVNDLPFVLDLYMIGQPANVPADSANHRFIGLGQVSDAEKFSLMKGASVVLAPSLFEGFGIVPAEAMYCGTPVVAYDLPVLREVYGDDIHYAKHGDRDDFRRVVEEVVTGNARAKFRRRAHYQKRFSFHRMAEDVEQLPYHATKRTSVSVQLIAYWGFLPESLESVYPYVDDIYVAFGRTPHAPVVDDGSLERIKAFPDPDKKIRLEIRDMWEDKRQMRERCASQAKGNHMLVLDGDEIWVNLDRWLANPNNSFASPRWVNLWHDADHWVYDHPKTNGLRWGHQLKPYGSVCPHYRFSWWRHSFYWKFHPMPYTCDGKWILDFRMQKQRAIETPDAAVYHLGRVLQREILEAKLTYYDLRDGFDKTRKERRRAFEKWDGKTGDCGDGIVDKVTWELPDIVVRAVKSAKGAK